MDDEENTARRPLAEIRAMLTAQQAPAIDFLSLPYKERLRLNCLRHELNWLKRGETAAAQVRKYLSDSERKELESRTTVDPLASSNQPDDLADYQRKLKDADLANSRADAYSKKKNFVAATRARGKAESLYETALVRLQELLASEPALEIWFDRDPYYEADREASPDCVGIPRLKNSKSIYRRGVGKSPADKNQPLIEYVEELINRYNWPEKS